MSDQGNHYGHEKGRGHGGVHTLYAGPIHEATRSGDQERMRQMEQEASRHVEEVRAALQELRSRLRGS